MENIIITLFILLLTAVACWASKNVLKVISYPHEIKTAEGVYGQLRIESSADKPDPKKKNYSSLWGRKKRGFRFDVVLYLYKTDGKGKELLYPEIWMKLIDFDKFEKTGDIFKVSDATSVQIGSWDLPLEPTDVKINFIQIPKQPEINKEYKIAVISDSKNKNNCSWSAFVRFTDIKPHTYRSKHK